MTIGAFTIIVDPTTNKFLLCHRRDKDMWNLPGGRVEDGESPWDGALREIQEEIGLTTIKLKELVGVHFKPESNDLVFTFFAYKTAEVPTTSDEADKIEYFSIDEIPPNTLTKQKGRIIEFFKNRAEKKCETVFYNQMGT